MNTAGPDQIGYAFALPRLLARLAGRAPRKAELSRWEAYGFGILVFGMSCVFAGRLLFPFVRPGLLQGLFLLLVPFAVWIAYLPLYFVNARVAALLRRLGLYTAPTNNSLQHFAFMALTSGIALFFLRDECAWIKSLGGFWLGLLACNLLALLILKFQHEP